MKKLLITLLLTTSFALLPPLSVRASDTDEKDAVPASYFSTAKTSVTATASDLIATLRDKEKLKGYAKASGAAASDFAWGTRDFIRDMAAYYGGFSLETDPTIKTIKLLGAAELLHFVILDALTVFDGAIPFGADVARLGIQRKVFTELGALIEQEEDQVKKAALQNARFAMAAHGGADAILFVSKLFGYDFEAMNMIALTSAGFSIRGLHNLSGLYKTTEADAEGDAEYNDASSGAASQEAEEAEEASNEAASTTGRLKEE